MSARAALLLCLWSCAVACGPPAPVNTGGTAPGVGDMCGTSGDVCQPGLVCGPLGTCDWGSCRDAPDPAVWCAGQLGVAPARSLCDVDGRCAVLQAGAGEPCAADDGCYAGLVCEQGSCVTLCVSSATCPGEGRACVERSPGSAQQICGPAPDCNTLPDPVVFCADVLGVSRSRVICAPSGRCDLRRSAEGRLCERDRECEVGLVCEERRCERPCEGTCEDASLTCVPRPSGGAGSLCRYVPIGCAAEEPFYCYEQTGWDYSECDRVTGECSQEPPPPPPVYHTIIIQDASSPSACASRTPEGLLAPGADIVSIEVYDSAGALLALVQAPSWTPGDGVGNDFVEPDLVASSQRAGQLGASEPVCPLLRQADGRLELGGMLSLGCGGQLKASFALVDPSRWDMWPDGVTQGMRVRIGEYAPVCDGLSEPDPDRYLVTLCEGDNWNPACTTYLTPQAVSGTMWFEVP